MSQHEPRSRLTIERQLNVGRLAIDIGVADTRMIYSRDMLKGSDDPDYTLVVPLRGNFRFSQCGRTGTAVAGEYLLLSQREFYEIASDDQPLLLMLRIPGPELRSRLASVDDHVARRFRSNEYMTRLLVDLLRGIADVFIDGTPPNPEALATEIVSFVALTIGAEDRGSAIDVRNTRYRLRRRIFAYIESNLGDQSLSPKKIAASSRISLSYLYSLFSDDETTVGQFLQGKRLQRAYEILVADPAGHLTVSEVAYQVGFKNVSHFSRTFSRHFHVAPRDARLSARTFRGGTDARLTPAVSEAPSAMPFEAKAKNKLQTGLVHGVM